MKETTIGILGGMGPRATVIFEQRLLDRLSGNDQQLPRIVSVNDGLTPDRTAFLSGKGSDPLPRLLQNAQMLVKAQATIICMPCNTAHASRILDRLQASIMIPIVDMPAGAVQAAENQGYRRLLILGTVGTRDNGVYDARTTYSKCIYPSRRDQLTVNSLIAKVKTGVNLELLRPVFLKVLESTDCDSAILACTELSMLAPDQPTNVPVIDAMEALIEQCVLQIDGYNKREETL